LLDRVPEHASTDPVQRLFELSVDMLGTATLDGYFTRLNPAWERTLGWTREELMAQPFVSFVHPDDVEATLGRSVTLAEASSPAVATFENRYRTRAGDYRAFQWTTIAQDGVLYFVAKDVTAPKAAEMERGQAASMTKAIMDNAADGLWVADSGGAIRYANASALRMLGYEADELIGRDNHSTLHHSRPDGTPFASEECPILAVRETGTVYEASEDCFWCKDGSMLPVAYSASAVPLADGVGTVVVFRDTTAQRAEAAARHEAELAIRSSEALHRTLTANLPDTTVLLLDHDLRVLVADGGAIRRLPWLEEDMFRGRKVSELYAEVPADVLEISLDNCTAALKGEPRAFDFSSDGLTFAIQAVPVRAEDGSVESVLVVARDVTARALAERQLARRVRQQNAVAELGRFALQSRDLDELMTEVVTTVTATLGVDVGGILELDDAAESLTVGASVGLPEGFAGIHIPLRKAANAGHTVRTGSPTIVEDLATETRFTPSPLLLGLGVVSSLSVLIDGHDQAFGVLNVHARAPHGFSEEDVAFLTAVAMLITVAVERHAEEEATRHAALHDPLTGLPNRTLAIDRLDQALARRQRERIDVAVFALDLDRFKMINDSLGHAAGDEVLLALAARLTAAVRPADTVARLGGDEFVVICPGNDVARDAPDIAERLAAAVNRPLVLDSGEQFFTISTGITLAATVEDTPESLLGDADAAMYRAKERGRGRYELFDEAMRTRVLTRVRTEAALRRALERGELQVWYQPVIDLDTGRVIYTEALVRWQHPDRGLIPPIEFIPIAEETGLIIPLGLHVLERACHQTAAWQKEIDPELGVSVNISGRQAINPLFPAQVAAVAARSGLRHGTLALEITETVFMEEADSPATVLGRFHEHGVTLALDDFGTGYSSLSRLKRFPLDALKIDRSFVSGVNCNADDRAIVKATIDMAHAVGLIVVAEGVETREQEDCLRALDCDRAQGYLYARPQPAPAITELLASAQDSRSASTGRASASSRATSASTSRGSN
jgi:diguanylate cyclase (GGDEF)-like protein/PAS domain S-box-containing protein